MISRRTTRLPFRVASLASLFFFALFTCAEAICAFAAEPAPGFDGIVEEQVIESSAPAAKPAAAAPAPAKASFTPMPWENGGVPVKPVADAKKEEKRKRGGWWWWSDPAGETGAAAGGAATAGVSLGTVGKWAAIGGGVIIILLALGGGGGGGGGSSTTSGHPGGK